MEGGLYIQCVGRGLLQERQRSRKFTKYNTAGIDCSTGTTATERPRGKSPQAHIDSPILNTSLTLQPSIAVQRQSQTLLLRPAASTDQRRHREAVGLWKLGLRNTESTRCFFMPRIQCAVQELGFQAACREPESVQRAMPRGPRSIEVAA